MSSLEDVGTEVSIEVCAPRPAVWAVVTDLSLTPRVNRETLRTTWIDPPDPGPGRFAAVNRLGDWEWEVTCHVTRWDPPHAFEWTVSDPEHPSSSWWHRLTALAADRTRIDHGFRHGPGMSGLRRRVADAPDDAEVLIGGRTRMLEDNMRHTLGVLAAIAEAGSSDER